MTLNKCFFTCGADPRPRYRDKYDKAACETDFSPLSEKQQWHERFSEELGLFKPSVKPLALAMGSVTECTGIKVQLEMELNYERL